MSRGSSVGIATGYRLDDRSSWVRFPAGAGNYSLLHCVQTGSGDHPASYPMDTRSFSLALKRLGRETDHSLPSRAKIKNAWRYISIPNTSSWHGA